MPRLPRAPYLRYCRDTRVERRNTGPCFGLRENRIWLYVRKRQSLGGIRGGRLAVIIRGPAKRDRALSQIARVLSNATICQIGLHAGAA